MRLRTLTEAECYARCYGARGDDNVTVVRVVRRERNAGEDLRRMFEERLDARDPEAEAA
jgi:hypothetical protein